MKTATVPESRTAAALAARRRKTVSALQRVHEAITRLRREKSQVSGAAVARRADVSRTFLYDKAEAKAAVATAIAEAGERRTQLLADQDDEREGTWRERALNAEEGLKAAQAEILTQRTRIGELLGQIRDLQADGPRRPSSGSPPRNTTLRQRVRQPTTAPSTSGSRPPAPTSASRTVASPTSKPRSRAPDNPRGMPLSPVR
ncbi:hypothetical protein [Streptomyces sp. NPDC002088]|uniref:hypothetical protein n=1 Tax=Streptomyces sp. NPDC002088 TaxID=3154665 RepID=UPI00332685CA